MICFTSLLLVCSIAAAPLLADTPVPGSIILTGQVVELRDVLEEKDIQADLGPIESQVVLRSDDGKIRPILSNDASRALFADPRLRDRPVEIKARVVPDLPYLSVLTLRVEEQGRLRSPEYHCEICTIDVRFPQACPCCQGPLELRFDPNPRDDP